MPAETEDYAMEYKSPTNEFKGSGEITILGLLSDDPKDQEMLKMTDLLQQRVSESGRETKRIDCAGGSLKQNKIAGQTLYVTGHSGFFDPEGKVRPVADRTLGGFPLDDVVDALFEGYCCGVTDIELWCCETACKNGTQNYDGGHSKTVPQNFDSQAVNAFRTNLEKSSWPNISTLDYLCGKLYERAAEAHKANKLYQYKPLTITGLNGVGYITDKDKYITTFDRGAKLKDVIDIGNLEKEIKQFGTKKGKEKVLKEKLKEKQKHFDAHIANRKCHFISSTLNFIDFYAEGSENEPESGERTD
jgi:hypothetical protein